MSSKYEGYNQDSDNDDSYDAHYNWDYEENMSNDDNIRKEENYESRFDSDTSEGNLSRESPTEEEKKLDPTEEFIKGNFIEVSPDSPIERDIEAMDLESACPQPIFKDLLHDLEVRNS